MPFIKRHKYSQSTLMLIFSHIANIAKHRLLDMPLKGKHHSRVPLLLLNKCGKFLAPYSQKLQLTETFSTVRVLFLKAFKQQI